MTLSLCAECRFPLRSRARITLTYPDRTVTVCCQKCMEKVQLRRRVESKLDVPTRIDVSV